MNPFVRTSLPGWCGLAALFGSLYFFWSSSHPPFLKAIWIIGIIYVVLFCVEAALCIRGKFGLIAAPVRRPLSIQRIWLKLLGWALTLIFAASPYWLFPEYSTDFYQPFYDALQLTWPYLAAFFFACLLWEDARAEDEKDEYYYLGAAAAGFNPAYLKNVNLKQHALRWLVKIFFLPLMFVYLSDYLSMPSTPASHSTLHVYDWMYGLIFLIDTAFVTTGYIFGNKLLDTHIRSAEPTMLGWAVTIMCYQPFWSFFEGNYLRYSGSWADWLSAYPGLQVVWVILIMAFLFLYVWATIAFGSRFSNLTCRGILVCGPYAYMRHPAYIGKLGSFFLMYVPFISNDWTSAARNLLIWGALAGVYYLRAKTEEAHFRSLGPEYDMYAKEVSQNWRKLWSRK